MNILDLLINNVCKNKIGLILSNKAINQVFISSKEMNETKIIRVNEMTNTI